MSATKILTATALMVLVATTAFGATINEIRIDMPGADNDEYVELAGQPGESLDGLTYVVIGDNSTNHCGNIENATDLTGVQIQADGLLSIGDAGTSGSHTFTYDVELDLNFENSDNVTHMIVSGFTGAINDDVDADDDCQMDNTPWASVVDMVALWEGTVVDCAGFDECTYGSVIVGPDGNFVPGHIYLCPQGWMIGGFTLGTDDTPGEPNGCGVPVEPGTWGGVKAIYR